ncbi:protein of unknown function [Thermanaeromonas toyohensis ToBE]|uniref:Galactose mutarotase n=1 Tax=Thermanaeromonas toyohensis ToBE TaxID=698762 RepID=A0A1W1VC56_9FIRM|nr:aldose 1-epimerase family protein [Thermanaeromonas toyohensis]SMB90905.1 protein of unknown function [Thermanaeromonas toyohensis ToBE]
MVWPWGGEISFRRIKRYCGSIKQLAGITRFIYAEGKAAGLEAAEVRTGAGFRFVVLLGRGMDIGLAEYKGIPLAFYSPVGEAHPKYYEPSGLGWLRNFGGGLLVTCGLTQVGTPCEDYGEELGLHGRISNIPAEEVGTGGYWEGEKYVICVQGKVREASAVFGPHLVLKRRIWTYLGEKRLFLEDVVVNEGFTPVPHMLLYHINIGFPVLDEGSELLAPSRRLEPRDEVAAKDLANYRTYQGPTPGFPDTVFYHDLEVDQEGWTQAALVNPRLNMGVYVRYEKKNLPNFIQWKFTNEGNYVAGLEPANCRVEGRVRERERGTLVVLLPGEERCYRLEIGVLASKEEIEIFREGIKVA